MTTKSKPKPPTHLSAAMKKWWEQVEHYHLLEGHHRHLLRLAAEAYDRAQAARKVLDKDGVTFIDRFGCPKLRPEVAVERDCRRDFAKLLDQLDLDEESPA
jgi:phage terminase small subunit